MTASGATSGTMKTPTVMMRDIMAMTIQMRSQKKIVTSWAWETGGVLLMTRSGLG